MATGKIAVLVHNIEEDGLPDMSDDQLIGRVAFIFDGCVVTGWPLVDPEEEDGHLDDEGILWEGDSDVANNRRFSSVTHWVEFPAPIWELVRED